MAERDGSFNGEREESADSMNAVNLVKKSWEKRGRELSSGE